MGLLQNLFMQIKPIENGQKQFLAGTRSKAKGEKKMRKQIDDNTKPNLTKPTLAPIPTGENLTSIIQS